eukprot:1819310-Pyramimonas_sp.AAC.1
MSTLNEAHETWQKVAWSELRRVTGYEGRGLPGGAYTDWMEVPVRKVLMAKSYSKLDPQRALSWAINRLQEVRVLSDKGCYTPYYYQLVRSLLKRDKQSPFQHGLEDGCQVLEPASPNGGRRYSC